MKLVEWAEREGLTKSQLAARFGTTHATVSRLLNGKRRPGWALLEKITAETKGDVREVDFFGGLSIEADADSLVAREPRGGEGQHSGD